MYKYKITIAYDGQNYYGWQRQKSKLSIQGMIEEKLSIILRKKILIVAAGRTDGKAHALGQVAHFTFDGDLDVNKLTYAMNCTLPRDIRILHIEKADLTFHARFSAKAKVYQYHISKNRILLPFERFYVYSPKFSFDIKLLKEACNYFLGKKDFSAFANEGSNKKNPVKTIYRIDVIEDKDKIILEFTGSGFLYKMIRNIVGTLLDAAGKKIPLEDIKKILESKDRKKAKKPAPAQGLFLVKIIY